MTFHWAQHGLVEPLVPLASSCRSSPLPHPSPTVTAQSTAEGPQYNHKSAPLASLTRTPFRIYRRAKTSLVRRCSGDGVPLSTVLTMLSKFSVKKPWSKAFNNRVKPHVSSRPLSKPRTDVHLFVRKLISTVEHGLRTAEVVRSSIAAAASSHGRCSGELSRRSDTAQTHP